MSVVSKERGQLQLSLSTRRHWRNVLLWILTVIVGPIFVNWCMRGAPGGLRLLGSSADCYRKDNSCEVRFQLKNASNAEVLIHSITFKSKKVTKEATLGEFLTPIDTGVLDISSILEPGREIEHGVQWKIFSGEIEELKIRLVAKGLKRAEFVRMVVEPEINSSEGKLALPSLNILLPWDLSRKKAPE